MEQSGTILLKVTFRKIRTFAAVAKKEKPEKLSGMEAGRIVSMEKRKDL